LQRPCFEPPALKSLRCPRVFLGQSPVADPSRGVAWFHQPTGPPPLGPLLGARASPAAASIR